MESVQCAVESADFAGPDQAAFGSCREYVLQSENVLFHLHAKGKGSQLLPIGKDVEYRINEGHFYLRLNGHEREYSVVAMEPLEPRQPAVHSAQKINHLQ